MKTPIIILIVVFSFAFFISACNNTDSKTQSVKSFQELQTKHLRDTMFLKKHSIDTGRYMAIIYLCPINCIKDSIYDKPGQCSVCGTKLRPFETIRIKKTEN